MERAYHVIQPLTCWSKIISETREVLMNKENDKVTTVIDAGARYGMHPSWDTFRGELQYFAFEPDSNESDRLTKLNKVDGFKVVKKALAKERGNQNLHITKHKGYCSFLEIDPESDWFKIYRPGEGELEKIVSVPTISIDEFAESEKKDIDFLKLDTEGTELDVLMGAEKQLDCTVLGVRSEVCFQRCYKNQQLFTEVHQYLVSKDFFLLNLDYFGKGVPRNCLCRTPDPLSADSLRFGTLVGTDGVWLKHYSWIFDRYAHNETKFSYAVLKYAYFCLLNNAVDVCVDTLLNFVKTQGGFMPAIRSSEIYLGLRKDCMKSLSRWRVYPDETWQKIMNMFKTIFGIELKSGSDYWELLQEI